MNSHLSISTEELSQAAIADGSLQQSTDLFLEHGALWLKNCITESTINKMAKAYEKKYIGLSDDQLKERNACVGDRRFMLTVDVKGAFNHPDVYANPILMPILNSLLSEHCRIASFGSVVAFPDADDQPIHLDHPPLFGSQTNCDDLPPHAITVVVPLVDITPEMGTTAIWEGTHRSAGRIDQLQSLMERPDFSSAAKPLPKRGDVYLMDYRVIHGGLANRSSIPRPILYIVYSRPWFKDGYNFTTQAAVSISKKQLKKVPKRHRSLFL